MILNFFGIYILSESNSHKLLAFDEKKLAKYPIVLLDGYFQSYLYFEDFKEEILKSVFFEYNVEFNYKVFLDSINLDNSVAVHVRRMQYEDKLGFDYYFRAMELMTQKLNNPNFFIFSDDIEWCRENFRGENVFFIDVESANEIQELYLMSLCKSHVIANSSFSWWGAYLSKEKDNLVIAPSPISIGVFGSLIPKNWIEIQSDI